MKKILILLIATTISFASNAQENKLKVTPFYDNDSSDIYGVLHLLNIDIEVV